MLKIPDIIGYTLREALEILDRENIVAEFIEVTSAPRLKCQQLDHGMRVVRTDPAEDNKIKLFVCKPL